MFAYVLKREDGSYWGVGSKYKNAVIFLDEGEAYIAWNGISNETLEIVKVEIKEVDTLLKIWTSQDSKPVEE